LLPAIGEIDGSVVAFRRIAEQYGPNRCVWRYDTIIFSSLTPVDFHRRNFEDLSRDLEGATDEVVISFVHLYQKTLRNMNWAAAEFGFEWEEPLRETKRALASEMVEMARARGMKLSVCAQRDLLVPGAADARCIDSERLQAVAGKPIVAELRGGRKECGCFASKDIGEYDTCPHGCVYCYAVQNRSLAQRRHKEHDPNSEFLFPVSPGVGQEIEERRSIELPLFPNEDPDQE
jgi:hypothetical protein